MINMMSMLNMFTMYRTWKIFHDTCAVKSNSYTLLQGLHKAACDTKLEWMKIKLLWGKYINIYSSWHETYNIVFAHHKSDVVKLHLMLLPNHLHWRYWTQSQENISLQAWLNWEVCNVNQLVYTLINRI
jgi:hypothetical protein